MSAHTSLLLSVSWLAIALCSAGCDDSLKSVSLIEETRVLGARLEVETEPNRSSPRPGENAALRWFVAAPNAAPNFSYALSVCAVPLTNSGFPPCAGAPFASTVRAEPSGADARLDFRVPEDLDLELTPHAFASGLICPDSGLNLDPEGAPSCLTGTGTQVAFEFLLGGPEQSNHSPSFSADTLTLDDEPWPASTEASCDTDALRHVTSGSLHVLRLDLADSDFELLPRSSSLEPAREMLLVSPFSSAGKWQHGFLALSADTPPEQRRVAWDAPTNKDALGSLVRFYFVVRDARGGEDFTSRALCVVP
jgi:hypothetical protein